MCISKSNKIKIRRHFNSWMEVQKDDVYKKEKALGDERTCVLFDRVTASTQGYEDLDSIYMFGYTLIAFIDENELLETDEVQEVNKDGVIFWSKAIDRVSIEQD